MTDHSYDAGAQAGAQDAALALADAIERLPPSLSRKDIASFIRSVAHFAGDDERMRSAILEKRLEHMERAR